ncbi:MAG: hypothetical protein JWR72_1073 [Flavisolibacter sp.]|jgi:hypothetical protein|nr:hypothetical protein [Flavisolibacter sp.]
MRSIILLLFISTALYSCFLFKDYRKKEFVYSRNGQTAALPIIVPKGYLKQETADTAGVTLHTFYYTGGAILYAAFLTDTTAELQPIYRVDHQPQIHRLGGLVYKGQDESNLYYREIRQGPFRFGYRFVPEILEFQFDSATNFASLQKR